MIGREPRPEPDAACRSLLIVLILGTALGAAVVLGIVWVAW